MCLLTCCGRRALAPSGAGEITKWIGRDRTGYDGSENRFIPLECLPEYRTGRTLAQYADQPDTERQGLEQRDD